MASTKVSEARKSLIRARWLENFHRKEAGGSNKSPGPLHLWETGSMKNRQEAEKAFLAAVRKDKAEQKAKKAKK